MTTKLSSWTAAGPSALSRFVKLAIILGAIPAIFAISAMAVTTKIIYRLTESVNGNTPDSALVRDAAGNLYGTTISGGNPACSGGCGVAFELSPTSEGGWKDTVLHSFTGGLDGDLIFGGLALDAAGNLYGTATRGGKYGFGNVFELSPVAGHGWKFSVLYAFKGENDGTTPAFGVILDSAGNLYGVNSQTVFELSPVAGGGWKHTVLHVFQGLQSLVGVTLDASGNLFGATADGGISNGNCELGCGTVYELSQVAGVWKETTLYSFTGNADGAMPLGNVTLDSAGNVYGVTGLGGNLDSCPSGCGVVYELTPSGSAWNESVLLAFNYADGEQPHGQLVFDASGNLYGTTQFDNQTNCGCGLVYELSPASGGLWNQTVLHIFVGGSAGQFPAAGLTADGAGNFYGTTEGGGNVTGSGTIFVVTP